MYCPKNIEHFDSCNTDKIEKTRQTGTAMDKSQHFLSDFPTCIKLIVYPDPDRQQNGQSDPDPYLHQKDADPQP
jgi:hypothetical protein